MSDSDEIDPEKHFKHMIDCARCLREFWEEHGELVAENEKLKAELKELKAISFERPTGEHHFEHNRLMSPEFAAIKAEILSRTGWRVWHLDVNYHNQLVFMQADPADIWSICWLNVFPATYDTRIELKTRTFYAEYYVPHDTPKAIHQILDDLFDPSSPKYIGRK